jgi:dipeptidyl aminopeptidase/acylaminoacyl peptidase
MHLRRFAALSIAVVAALLPWRLAAAATAVLASPPPLVVGTAPAAGSSGAAALAAPLAGAAAPSAGALASPAAATAADAVLEGEVARMARVGGCWSPSFSPDGLRLAFVSNLSGVPQVWTVPADGGWPEQVTSFDDPVNGVEWSPDGSWLAFSLAPGGGMNSQVYLVRPDGKQLVRVSDGGKANNILDGWRRDGRALLLSSNRADPASLDPFTYDLATGAWRRAAPGGGDGTISDVSRDGRSALVERVRQRGDDDVYAIDLETGREALLTPHQPPASFGVARFSPDGSTVYLSSNRDRDRSAFARLRLPRAGSGEAPGSLEVVAARDDAELEAVRVADDGHTAALLWNVAGRSQLSFVDLATLAETPGPALPGEVVRDMEFSANGRLLALTLTGSRQPQDIWVLDRASGRLRQITHTPHGGVDLAALAAPELVRFSALDGLELSGWLYRPAGRWSAGAAGAAGGAGAAAAGAVVLSLHGGPESQERPAWNPLYQALLARGIAVFAPNVRGSAGFGKRFVNLDNGALRADAVRDLRAAVEYLVRQGIADPRRVGIMGGSYGGYMTMAGLTEFPELFAAGADLYGIVNFETFFAHTEPWMAAISKVEYGDPDTQKDLLRALSPIHRLDRVKAPTLVLHGANDTNVPVVEAEQVVSALRQRGVPVEYVLFPDEGHGFRKTANRIRAAVAVVRFFAAYLAAGAPRPTLTAPQAGAAAPQP